MSARTSPFSFRRNLASLFQRPASSVPMLDGVRALSILWVIAVHVSAIIAGRLPPPAGKEMAQIPWLRVVWSGDLGVDAFFVMSGFLICRLLLDEKEATSRIRVGRFYLRRALRLLPAYYLVLLILFLVKARNRDMVWANVFYVVNFVPNARQFMSWAWSLAIEEQFYIVFPLLLLGFWRLSLSTRLWALSLLFVLSLAIPLAVAAQYRLGFPMPVFPWLDRAAFQHAFDVIYDKPHTRYGALLLGVIVEHARRYTGVVAWLDRHPRTVYASFVLLGGAVLAVILNPFRDPDYAPSSGWFAYAFVAEYRFIYCFAVGYAMLLCFSKHPLGRVLDRVLGHRAFYPIAQLSYSAYLIHPIILVVILRIAKQRVIPSAPKVIALTAFASLAVFIVSTLVFLLIERPFMNMRPGDRGAR